MEPVREIARSGTGAKQKLVRHLADFRTPTLR